MNIIRIVMEFYVLIVILSFILGQCTSDGQLLLKDDYVDLNITDGTIRGTIGITADKDYPYFEFRGIPYAEPPVNELRFEPPVSKKPWTGTLNCTYDKSECTQGSSPVSGSEDCLFINVYTRSLSGKSAVLVYIHGGAFIAGNSSKSEKGPDQFLNEGLVFVQFNYRLGVFGFMSTEDMACPGNLGLKDQVVALKWIKKNIAYFGGDPNNVTIFGQSAGATSVSYHMQSKLSKGLFKGAIMDSGTSLCLWTRARTARSTAFAVGSLLGILTSNSKKLMTRLKKVSFDALQEAAFRVFTKATLQNVLAGLAFAPVKEIIHDGAFFSENSEETLEKGDYTKVPSLLGVNSNEAASVNSVSGALRLYLAQYDVGLPDLAPADLNGETGVFQPKKMAALLSIKCNYWNCGPINLAPEDKICEFISDDQFNRPVIRTAVDLSQYSLTYLYVFAYIGSLGGSLNRTLTGVGHSEELPYLFRSNRPNISDEDILISKRMVKMWSNFAKYGNPTPYQDPLLQNVTWIPAQGNDVSYMNIDKVLTPSVNPFSKSIKFYNHVYQAFGSAPYDTY